MSINTEENFEQLKNEIFDMISNLFESQFRNISRHDFTSEKQGELQDLEDAIKLHLQECKVNNDLKNNLLFLYYGLDQVRKILDKEADLLEKRNRQENDKYRIFQARIESIVNCLSKINRVIRKKFIEISQK